MVRTASAVACCLAFLLAGCEPVETSTSGLESAAEVPPEQIAQSGAVLVTDGITLCSGYLVTPLWALTAGHCRIRAGTRVSLGNLGNTSAPSSRIYREFPHPNFVDKGDDSEPEFDAKLLMLTNPLYPRASSGESRTTHDIALVDGPISEGNRLNVYAHGATDDNTQGVGVLRFGRFVIDAVNDQTVEIDGDDALVQGGDSGAAMLAPDHDQPGAWNDYRIVGVVAKQIGSGFLGLDARAEGPDADTLREWFNATRSRYNGILAPDQVMAAIAY